MLQSVPQILNFGFLGLSFLMLFLGYRLTHKVIEDKEDRPESVKISKFFLKISLAFMILAGPLQWITIAIMGYAEDHKVTLFVGASNPSWDKKFHGEVYMSRQGHLEPISKASVKKEFSDNEEVKIELSEVITKINSMRQQIKQIDLNSRLQNSIELQDTLAGG